MRIAIIGGGIVGLTTALSLARAGFRATAGRPADAFGGVWQQWHGDLLAGGRGEIFHRLRP